MDLIRYEFLLDSMEGDSQASLMLSDLELAGQYIIRDEEITSSISAAFQYCMIPDYFPSPSVSPSPSIIPSSSPTSLMQTETATQKKNSDIGIIAGSVVGGSLLLIAIGAIFAFVKLRKNRKVFPSADLELREHSTNSNESISVNDPQYNPISIMETQHYTTVQVDAEWSIPYNHLRLTKELGRGAFGVVYQGIWEGTPVAVKQALAFNDHSQQQDFFSEAEVMKKLTPHPNVTRLLGLCSSPFCIVLEFVDNGSLSHWLARKKPLSKENEISIAFGIAQGMLHLHKAGIIHRDLAARNILLNKDMVPKVSDFGMSRQTLEDKTNKTVSDIGPIRWMAPEAMKQKVYNKKTDVWSFGIVLYEILTRNIPYQNLDLVHVATNVSAHEISLVPEIQKEAAKKEYPTVLVKILELCLSFEPQSRPNFESIVAEFDT